MREPKYRAWHKQQKKMYPVKSLIWFDAKIDPKNMLDSVYLLERIDRIQTKLHILSPDDVELMEYIGVKDNYDKEGCQDDLVLMYERSVYQIVWNDYYARFEMKWISGNEDEIFKVMAPDQLKFGEIIGNIYENPELTPEAKQQ